MLVLDETLPRALEFLGTPIAELGWERVSANMLTVPMAAGPELSDRYLLRLNFLTGREWPPSAQFVNPDTLEYEVEKDIGHLPRLQSPEVHLHPSYSGPNGRPMQLICCSATLEFYEVLHDVQLQHIWRDNDTFLVTLDAIRRSMVSHYHGRWNA